MKKLYSFFIPILITGIISGQSPAGFNYQAVARNASGQLIINTQINIQIAILKGSITGTSVYVETFSRTTNNFGLVNLNIGSGSVVSGNFPAIDWGADTYYIKIWLNGTEMGTSQLLSVPYALYSKKAETISGSAITGNEDAFKTWDKDTTDDVTISGEQAITGNKTFTGITTVPAPVNSTDAVNKAYVDDLRSQIENLQIQVGIQDIDGNYYAVIKIGTQLWMGENLKTKRYSNGDLIPTTTPFDKDIGDEVAPKYQWVYEPVIIAEQVYVALQPIIDGGYGDLTLADLVNAHILTSPQKTQLDSALYIVGIAGSNTKPISQISEECAYIASNFSYGYGLLYTWYAATDSRNICPAGWHVPTDSDWTVLIEYLTNNGFGYEGSGNDIAKSMAAISGWKEDPTPGNVGNDIESNNSSEFNAVPSGYRFYPGSFHSIGWECVWWSATEESTENAHSNWLRSENSTVFRTYGSKLNANSIRCIRD